MKTTKSLKNTFRSALTLAVIFLISFAASTVRAGIVGDVEMGNLTDYLFVFTDGSTDANWQGASKGFVGNVAVNGLSASERTSGTVPFAGTISTNDSSLGQWQSIVNSPTNSGQAFASTGQASLISGLQTDLASAFAQINALAPVPGFSSVSAISLNGLNTQDGINKTYVINVTSGFNVSSKLNITGDAGDVFVLRVHGKIPAHRIFSHRRIRREPHHATHAQ